MKNSFDDKCVILDLFFFYMWGNIKVISKLFLIFLSRIILVKEYKCTNDEKMTDINLIYSLDVVAVGSYRFEKDISFVTMPLMQSCRPINNFLFLASILFDHQSDLTSVNRLFFSRTRNQSYPFFS